MQVHLQPLALSDRGSSFVDLHHTRAQSSPYLVISLINYSFTKIHFFSADYEGGPTQYLLTDFLSGLLQIKQSVNGLICGYLRKSKSIFIVNPTTPQFVTLPPTHLLMMLILLTNQICHLGLILLPSNTKCCSQLLYASRWRGSVMIT
ncbi:hypothetical protein HYC85_012792 [Camellia sinensis]|uniref:Uncharacterized protein n=1 Tax=Camellia sinensis TaxID=4442 RepID=A0A7J7HDI1_CAMSI|nr:hypothetical protein HYC85_012792 [Camellia sinensis]